MGRYPRALDNIRAVLPALLYRPNHNWVITWHVVLCQQAEQAPTAFNVHRELMRLQPAVPG